MQAGRFLAAYLYGVPVADIRPAELAAETAAAGGPRSLLEVVIYRLRHCNCGVDGYVVWCDVM